jgi:hypothetical protein
LHELQRRRHDVGGVILVGTLELQHELAGAITLEPFVGNPLRVNNITMRSMIRLSRACSSAALGARASWNTGPPSRSLFLVAVAFRLRHRLSAKRPSGSISLQKPIIAFAGACKVSLKEGRPSFSFSSLAGNRCSKAPDACWRAREPQFV